MKKIIWVGGVIFLFLVLASMSFAYFKQKEGLLCKSTQPPFCERCKCDRGFLPRNIDVSGKCFLGGKLECSDILE